MTREPVLRDRRLPRVASTDRLAVVSSTPRPSFVVPYLILLVLVAFALRLHQIEVKSFWFDEGLSVFEARAPLRDLIPTLIRDDIHPPLYYGMLAAWIRAVGTGEFAVRYLSLLAGALLVPAVYQLGRTLFAPSPGTELVNGVVDGARPAADPWSHPAMASHLVGLGGATLVAFSPFLIYYSQEARMYAILAVLAVVASISFWRVMDRPSPVRWAGYALVVAGLAYTHYFGVFVLGVHLAYFVLTLRSSYRRIPSLAVALLVAGVLYLPWAPGAVAQLLRLQAAPDFWSGELSLTWALEQLTRSFVLGRSGLSTTQVVVASGALGLTVVAGALGLWRGLVGRRGNDLFLVLGVFVPLACLYALTARQPKFTERYVIMALPAFYLLIARVAVILWQLGRESRFVAARLAPVLGAAGFALMLGISAVEVPQVYGGANYAKQDFRGVAEYIAAREEPGDAIGLLMDSHQAFEVYYRGNLPITSLHVGANAEAAAHALNTATTGKRRLWLVLWQEDWGDPAWYVRDALFSTFSHYPIADEFVGIKIVVFDISHQVTFDARLTPQVASPVNFDNRVHLLGYDLPRPEVAAGGEAPIVFYWQAATTLVEDLSVSIRLRDDDHVWWHHDSRPAAFTYPTFSWRPDQLVRGRLSIAVPPGTPPGEYAIEVSLYSQQTGRDLPVLDGAGRGIGTSQVIGTIQVKPPETVVAGPADGASPVATIGDLALASARVETAEVVPGGEVHLELLWHALAAIRRDYTVRLLLRNAAGGEAVVAESPPASGRWPASTWREGEIVRDRHRFSVPVTAAAGPASIVVALFDGDQEIGRAEVGLVTIRGRPVVVEPPSDVDVATDFRFEPIGRLIGYRVSGDRVQPGDELRLTLFWQATASSEIPYTVFTHLIDGENKIWAQHDSQPQGGVAPTTGWQPGEYLRDEYVLRLRDDAPPGQYVVEVGLYDPATGARLPVRDGGGNPIGDHAVIAPIEVVR